MLSLGVGATIAVRQLVFERVIKLLMQYRDKRTIPLSHFCHIYGIKDLNILFFLTR